MKNSFYKKLVVLILLPAISWLFFNSVYYRHLHQSTTGFVISHAHPFNKTTDNNTSYPFASHEHSKSEFVLYDIISNTILPVLVGLFILLLLFQILTERNNLVLQERIYKSDYYLLQNYRGPPSNF
ncbi:hypothetical protein ACFLSE_00910 [Bacteroidota bacterium]